MRVRRYHPWRIVGLVVLALLIGSVAFAGGLLAAPIDFTAPPPPKSAVLLDASGRVVATLRSPTVREDVPLDRVPEIVRQAVLASEDRTFYSHTGVDPLAIVRAAINDIEGKPVQGGSTITQQYVKNVYVGRERTLSRKLKEAALAIRLEQRLSKNEILHRYLNAVYLGQGVYGVQAASKYYFGVPVDRIDVDRATGRRDPSLGLARAALLAGIIPAPSVWNPVHSPATARERQLDVLNRMVESGIVNSAQASAAYGDALPAIVAAAPPGTPTIAPEFRDLVADQLRHQLGVDNEDLIYRGGLRVTTTLDLDLQQAVVDAVGDVLHSPRDPEAAVIAIDPRTGDIKALTTRFVTDKVTGYQAGGTNLVTDATRSTGSVIKPFTLVAALQAGHSLEERVYAPRVAEIPNPTGTPNPYRVLNAEPEDAGETTLEAALWNSVNTVYAPLAVSVGLAKVMHVAAEAGLAPVQNLNPCCPAKALGVEVTPMSVATAYSTLVDHGIRHAPRSVLDIRAGAGGAQNGELIYRATGQPKGKQVIDPTYADAVTKAMAGVVNQGTATAARQPFTVYGKTGTTNDYTNAWFVGCTPQLCIATWMGYDKQYLGPDSPHSMVGVEGVSRVYGGTLPAQIFAKVWDHYRSERAAEHQPVLYAPAVAAPSPSPIATHRSRVRRTAPPAAPPSPTVAPTAPAGAPPTGVPATAAPPTAPATEPPATGSPPATSPPPGGGIPVP